MKNNQHRLSPHVQPSRYKLTIKPDLNEFTFSGQERIHLSVAKSTKTITLHAFDIKVISASMTVGKTKHSASKFTYNKKGQTVTLVFNKSIKGEAVLDLEFTGLINNKLKGFYKSSYTHKGQEKYLATTQFEATDARRAFPCFDEPAHKAIFDVTLIIPNHLTAISNTTEVNISAHDEHYKVVQFAPTPKMSTYLLAFIVGELESIETKTKDGVVIRVFTTPGKTKQAKFALDVAKRATEFLSDYFAISYELPVLDLIAIPDFSAGAMENWGAITFRETALLVDEKHTPFINRQRVAEVIAHELAHQWFGNLVTMEWWTHLWLNESFADYMAYVTVDHLFPEWHFWTRFVLGEHSTGLLLDGLQSTHPVEVEVKHPDQISQIFDAISYSKGASLLRMLSNYIGAEDFRDGLRLYLKNHSYKNTSSIHLWEAFDKVSGKKVSKLMKKWTENPGYPIVTASVAKNRLLLTQQKFTFQKNKQSKMLWDIPAQCTLATDKVSHEFLLSKKQDAYTLPEDYSFIKLNHDETAFFRSLYSPELLAQLLPAIKRGELKAIEQLGVVRDLFQASKAGYIGTEVYLEALSAFRDSDSYIVWMQIAEDMHTLHNLYAGDNIGKHIAKLGESLFSPLVKKYGWVNSSKETTVIALLRAIAIRNSARYGSTTVQKKAISLFKAHLKGTLIDPNLRSAVYGAVAELVDEKLLHQMTALYQKETMVEEKNRLAYAIMSVKNKNLAQAVSEFAFSETIKSQDRPFIIYSGLENPATRLTTWKLLKKHWPKLVQESTGSLLSRIVASISHFNNESLQQEALAFFKKAKLPVIKQAIDQAKEQIEIANRWKASDGAILGHYFKKLK